MRYATLIVACMVVAPLALGPVVAVAQGGPAPGGIAVTTAELARLCTAGSDTGSDTGSAFDTASAIAVGSCRGFMVGVGQYHAELTSVAAGQPPAFCLPEPSPTFNAAQASFVAWFQANPQHAGEKAVVGLMRWAVAAFPCRATPARASSAAAAGSR